MVRFRSVDVESWLTVTSDEAHPTCGGCSKRGLKCEYGLRVRWNAAAGSGRSKRRKSGHAQDVATANFHQPDATFVEVTSPEQFILDANSPLNQLIHAQASSPSISVEATSRGDEDNFSDESAEEWEVDDESEGQIDRSLFDTPGEYLVFVYCESRPAPTHLLSLIDLARYQIPLWSAACL